jgi:glycosyltransferase involved in cell wall biosynthesis
VDAIRYIKPGCQIVLCAGSPDTKEIGIEMKDKIEKAKKLSKNKIIWIPQMLPRKDLISVYSQASIFVCPSVYEPFGIINLEAMACRVPVVASKVGGIPEVVVHGQTGLLVPLKHKGVNDSRPQDPNKFAKDLAKNINLLLGAPQRMEKMGILARKRVEDHFSWRSIALKTIDFYKILAAK